MKKLLLVMLVPVLVLGLFSCGGKLLDADMTAFDLQGAWANADKIVMVLSGNQATLYSEEVQLQPAAYRVEITPTKIEVGDEGTIKFVGFKDKKAAEIATAKFTFTDESTITFGEVKRADDAVSYLLPANDDVFTKLTAD